MTHYESEPARDDLLDTAEREARRQAVRENAKHVFRESGLPEMLQQLNREMLKGRGSFEQYDSLVLLRWGTQSTRRHLWIEVRGNTISFRFLPHRKCTHPTPLCDGEYHTFTPSMWADRQLLEQELHKYYNRPVAETSSD